MIQPSLRLLAPAALALAAAAPAMAAPSVVATIKPLHSLVAGVMDGVGEPALLVDGAASPHGFALRPSDAVALEGAEIVFWIGPDLETFLPGPLASLAGDAAAIEMMAVDGMTILELRAGGLFEAHTHDHGHDHDHDHHDDHDHDHGGEEAHGHHDDHDHHDHETHDHDHETHGHDHGHGDAHIWLDTQNARLMVAAIVDALSTADPDNAQAYDANGRALAERISGLEADLGARMADLAGTFFVFHDAYHYFENRFDIAATGSFTVNPEIMPGARRLQEIRETVAASEAACLFAEPQFEPRLIETVAEGTGARIGVLDPLGAAIANGPDLYFEVMTGLAQSFEDCLGEG